MSLTEQQVLVELEKDLEGLVASTPSPELIEDPQILSSDITSGLDELDEMVPCTEENFDIDPERDTIADVIDIDKALENAKLMEVAKISLLAKFPGDILQMGVVSERQKMVAICKDPSLIGSIDKPSEELLIAAVTILPNVLPLINKKKIGNVFIDTIAVRLMPSMIRHVNEQTDYLCNLALTGDVNSFYFIKEPSLQVCKNAININPQMINGIPNPSLELCKYALEKDSNVFFLIKNPTEEITMAAIDINPNIACLIRNWTPKIAEKLKGKGMQYLRYVPDEDMIDI